MLCNDLKYIIRLSTLNLRWKKRSLLIIIIITCDLIQWLELLLLGETSDVRWQRWWCYSQLVFQVWVSQSWAEPGLCKSQFWKEKLEISCSILQWFLNVLCHVSSPIWDSSPRQTDPLEQLAGKSNSVVEQQLYPCALVLSTHPVLHVSCCSDAQGLPFSFMPKRPDQTVLRAVYGPEAGGSPSLC